MISRSASYRAALAKTAGRAFTFSGEMVLDDDERVLLDSMEALDRKDVLAGRGMDYHPKMDSQAATVENTPDAPWIDAPEEVGEIPIRYRQVYSHALSFEFMDEDGEAAVEGGVKWDGCINWNTSDAGMYHFCSADDAQRLTRAFERVWKLAAEHLPTWDGAQTKRAGHPEG